MDNYGSNNYAYRSYLSLRGNKKKIDIGLFKIINNRKILILGKEFSKEGVIPYY